MILAGALTLAGITGATAFIPETKACCRSRTKLYKILFFCKLEVILNKNLFSFKKGQETKTAKLLVSVYDSNHNLIDVIPDGYGRIFTAKQMEICMFNFMHLTFTIVLLVFLLLILFNKKRSFYRAPFISLANSLLRIHLSLLIRLYSIHTLSFCF